MSNYLFYDYEESMVCLIENNTRQYVQASTIHSYLDSLCLEYGSTLEGRKEAFKRITHQKKFIPICISIHPSIIYFPIDSIHDSSCIWIHYEAIRHIEYKEKTCILFFKDSTCLHCMNGNRIRRILQSIQKYLLVTAS